MDYDELRALAEAEDLTLGQTWPWTGYWPNGRDKF